MSLHRAIIILSIFAWCAYVNGQLTKHVDCRIYVYHPHCRGVQMKKRYIHSVEEKTDPACPCRNSMSKERKDFDQLASNNLLDAIFPNDNGVNSLYDAYAAAAAASDRRTNYDANRDRSSRTRKSTKDGLLADLGNPYIDQDY